jgi:hypothetical protein
MAAVMRPRRSLEWHLEIMQQNKRTTTITVENTSTSNPCLCKRTSSFQFRHTRMYEAPRDLGPYCMEWQGLANMTLENARSFMAMLQGDASVLNEVPCHRGCIWERLYMGKRGGKQHRLLTLLLDKGNWSALCFSRCIRGEIVSGTHWAAGCVCPRVDLDTEDSVAWVLERTIPTQRPPLVSEFITNFCR